MMPAIAHAQGIALLPAGSLDTTVLERIDGSVVTIDGRVDEAAWSTLSIIPVRQKVPVEGAPPSQPTEIRIGYDEEYLYLSGRLYDREPHRIVANTKKRDDFTENTEWVGLLIDTFDDRENALGFFVTPTGMRLDMAIANDAQGPNGIRTDWNAFWDAAATRDEDGWYAEIRIPFTSLPFSAEDGRTVMGITTWRYIARTDETAAFPPRGLSTGSSFRPSLTHRFVLTDIEPRTSVTVAPYSLVGRSSEIDPSDPVRARSVGYDREVGLDARFAFSGNVSIDVTANTDFAQVEVDDQQVNLSRAALFFPEKRLFFQERASLFDFAFGAIDRAFYSRRVGIVEGQRTGIYGGVRAVGRAMGWEGGLLSMQTEPLGSTPSENVSVLRIKRGVLDAYSSAGLIATRRASSGRGASTLVGTDAVLRLFGESFLTVRAAVAHDSENASSPSLSDRARVYAEFASRSQQGLTYAVAGHHSGPAYQPALGFASRGDLRQLDVNTGYNIFPGPASPWVQWGPFAALSHTWSASAGRLESRSGQLGAQFFSKSGWSISASGLSNLEDLTQPLALAGDVTIPVGRHTFQQATVGVTSPSSTRLAGFVGLTSGGFFDRSRTSWTVSPIVTVTPDLIVTGTYQLDRVSPPTGPTTTLQLVSAKVELYVSTRLSASTLVQYNSTSRLYVGSARIRFNPSEGTDLYVVWNSDLNADRFRTTPALPLSNRSSFQIKYTHAFRPSL
ncbi:MAG: DUF5916 domain-containing protein [Gemmatimonadota bacterium]